MHVVDKQGGESIRIQWCTFKGRTYLDIRTYYTDDTNEVLPTKKGITLRPDMLPQLIEALQAMQEDANP